MSKSLFYDDTVESHRNRKALPYLDLKDRLKIAQIPKRATRHSVDALSSTQGKVHDWFIKVITSSPPMHPEMKLRPEKQGVRVESERNLIVVGARQVGKTTAVAAALQNAIESVRVSGSFVSAAELFAMFTDVERNGGQLPDGYFDPLMLDYLQRKIDIVVIDDLGGEHLTEFRREAFQSFLAIRYNEMMPVIITTSLDVPAMKDRYGDNALRYLTPPNADVITIREP